MAVKYDGRGLGAMYLFSSGFHLATCHAPSPSRCSSRRVPSGVLLLLIAGTLMLTAQRGFAQYNTAEISGVVKDSQGAVLPGATVAAVQLASGLRVERTTDDAGRFFLPAMPVGQYTLSVELHGFKRFTQEGLILTVGQKIDVPVMLAIGQVSESI